MRGRVAVLAAALVAIVLVIPGPAQADVDCTASSGQIFWAAKNSQGAWQTAGHGTHQDIRWTPRDTFQACTPFFVGISTAHLRIDLGTTDWVEVGWRLCCNDGNDNVEWEWFAEYGVDHNVPNGGLVIGVDIPCSHPNNSYSNWQVQENPVGSHDWDLGITCSGGGGHNLQWFYNKFGTDSTGIPMTETERLGDTVYTGMSDSQKSPEFKGSGGNWNDWYDIACQADFADTYKAWNGKKLTSPLEYQTTSSGGTDC
jgi:hypothetical protein